MESTLTPPPVAYTKKNPFMAKVIQNTLLTKAGSQKETRHIVVDLSGGQLKYEPGYSLAISAENPDEIVDGILKILHLDPNYIFTDRQLRDVLKKDYALNRMVGKFAKTVAEKLPPGPKKQALEDICSKPEMLESFIFTRDYIDFLCDYPEVRMTPEELVGSLMKNNPRLYSIASSQLKHPQEIHLTVAIVRYETHGRPKKGLASGYLADDVITNETVIPVFPTPNKHFKLPENTDTPVIMVGPGTGIAPFRAFLQHREVRGDKGKNWLFFGEQSGKTSFLYEEEFTNYLNTGLLTKLSTAFSRDQEQKIYVQHRMKENGKEIWQWLQEGAYFYICGDASRMAKDVHTTLVEIAQEFGGYTPEQAEEYLTNLAKVEKRLLKDVY
jgi:sulfite reductase (NADPH) flavoprotein alpha-component